MSSRSTCLRTALLITLIATAAASGFARAQGPDVIRGRISDAEGAPVEGARVTATSLTTAVTRESRTDRNGRFTIVFPGAEGHYIMTVSMVGFLVKNFELRRTADQDILLADATLDQVQLETVVVTAPVRQNVRRGTTSTDVVGTTVAIPGNSLTTVQQGDLVAMASSLPGVLLLGGGEPGFSILGLEPSENSITVNGMTFDIAQLPREAGVNSSLLTNPYDVSRGGFSGAQLNVSTAGGSNILARGMSLNIVTPQLSWTDRASQAEGRDSTNLSLSGILAGPLKYNSAYYRFAYQYDRNSHPFRTLSNTSAAGLRSAGVAADSAARLTGVLLDLGVPLGSTGTPGQAVRDRGSASLALNLTPPTSSTAATYALNMNFAWTRSSPQNAGTTALPAYATRSEDFSASLQFNHTAYIKYFLLETTLGASRASSTSEPFVDLPAGRVRVNSEFEDGANGVANLLFGGNPSGVSESNNRSVSANSAVSWFSYDNKHRLKLAAEVDYDASSSSRASNHLGTFAFNSVADLQDGVVASFSRDLSGSLQRAGRLTHALSLGDSYRPTTDLQIQYGVRLDGGSYPDRPEYNPDIEAAFGVRNDRVPSPLYFSPRIGFSWTLGKAPQVTSFSGEAPTPRVTLRGGVAVQQSRSAGISAALNNTGLPGAIRSISCVGDAAPLPLWQEYLTDPDLIPNSCADGTSGTIFANTAPNVSLYSSTFRSPRSIRSNLSWQRTILDRRFNLTVTATHSLNLNRASQVDLNFDPTVQFTLDSEGSRPVFVAPSSIVPNTGAIASRGARVTDAFNRVNEIRSDLRSESRQLQVRLTPDRWRPIRYFTWRLAYTYQDVREQQRGFSNTAGNPLEVFWSPASNAARHQITYNLGYFFFRAIAVGWNGSITSGRPFTPMIGGDVNGDGASNDRAYIFNPAVQSDPALAAGMQHLLAATSPEARECLLRQLGQLAARNSCSGRWNVTGDLMIRIDAARLKLPNHTAIEFTFQNPLGGLDLMLHGSHNLRGWGQGAQSVDATLLYVRGFDPESRTYKYEVNQRFGTPRRSLIRMREPMRITALVKMDFGPVREKQTLNRNLLAGRSLPGARYTEARLRQAGVSSIPNPITSILEQADSLALTRTQDDSLARLSRRYSVRLDSIWAEASQHLADLPDKFELDPAWQKYLAARQSALDIMIELAPHIRGLLSNKQWRKLSMPLANAIDVRYLKAVRGGTDVYIGAPMIGGQ